MKIYTKTGDAGETGLFAGGRVRKDDVRIEACGTVDELNAALGLARCELLPDQIDETLKRVQSELFSVGAELATPEPEKHGLALIGDGHAAQLERAIDELESALPALKNFILPGGSRGAALLHVARGVCRRAERRVITLANRPASLANTRASEVSPRMIRYLNRLGDYLFVAARFTNQCAGNSETQWHKPA
jgi:cob(I)alamin adenosyltransferase